MDVIADIGPTSDLELATRLIGFVMMGWSTWGISAATCGSGG